VVDVIKPFVTEKSSHALRERLKVLSKEGYVALEKQRASVLVSLTEAGKKEAEA
jgi:Mn-dependent DtxR family transcriptional regulator